MNFTTFLKKTNAYLIVFIGFSLVTSCGSYQYVGVYEDGIYGDSEAQDYNANTTNDVSESVSGNSYYSDYFKGKSNEYNNNQETVFTDVEDYDSSYSPNNNTDSAYAGWGQNTDSNVIINIQSRPNYGMAWGWNNLGTFGWFASTTFLVMVMPLIFEVEREQMMKEMMQQQKAQQQSQASGSTIKMPAPGSLPSV